MADHAVISGKLLLRFAGINALVNFILGSGGQLDAGISPMRFTGIGIRHMEIVSHTGKRNPRLADRCSANPRG